jgi:hypothetical protein
MKREGMAASFNSVFDRHGEAVFWFALVMYVASFFLPSLYANDEFGRADPMRGYSCAYFSLGLSYAEIRGRLTEPAARDDRRPLSETISLLASGLVNPTFLLFAATSRFRRSGAVAHFLRILSCCCFPFLVFSLSLIGTCFARGRGISFGLAESPWHCFHATSKRDQAGLSKQLVRRKLGWKEWCPREDSNLHDRKATSS